MKDWQDIALFAACAVAMILLPALFGILAAIGAPTALPADFPMGRVVAGLSAALLVGGYAYFNSAAYRRRVQRRLEEEGS